MSPKACSKLPTRWSASAGLALWRPRGVSSGEGSGVRMGLLAGLRLLGGVPSPPLANMKVEEMIFKIRRVINRLNFFILFGSLA